MWNVRSVASLSMTQIKTHLTHHQLQKLVQTEEKKTAHPPKQDFHSIHTIFLHDPAWLELADDCVMR